MRQIGYLMFTIDDMVACIVFDEIYLTKFLKKLYAYTLTNVLSALCYSVAAIFKL